MDEAITQFLQFMALEKSAAQNTTAAYGWDIRQFSKYCGIGEQVTWEQIDSADVKRFLDSLKDKGLSDATIARRYTSLGSFFRYLQAEGMVSYNPVEVLSPPRVVKVMQRPLLPEQIDKLLAQPMQQARPSGFTDVLWLAICQRDKAILELLYATGMQISELFALDLSDLVERQGAAFVSCKGNGAKKRILPVGERSGPWLHVYLQQGRPELALDARENAVFLNIKGMRLSRTTFWPRFRRYARQANIQQSITINTLRYSRTAQMLRDGVPLQQVQALLGHSDISTTRLYTKLVDNYVRTISDRSGHLSRSRSLRW